MKKLGVGQILATLLFLFLLILPVLAEEQRPANFIFLLDVSGSMLYKSEMVTASDGKKVFLFEALREALKQIVEDKRLIGPESKTCVITFGTQVTEKSDWPQQLETDQKRAQVVQLIESPTQLAADKHGDTYMGGALTAALDKANKMYAQSDPCTTTFIIMLTDGWDEPPPGAGIKARDAATKFIARTREIEKKVGARTWKAIVIGLQNLPDRKAGTTTARELAGLLDGDFIDVTKQAGGTVSEKIFLALKNIVESLKGEITVAAEGSGTQMKNGVLQFGTVNGNGIATASFPVELKSCYGEDINAVTEDTADQPVARRKRLMQTCGGGALQLVCDLPPGSVSVKLDKANYSVAPEFNEHGERRAVKIPVTVVAQAHSNCPAGHFAGTFKIDASAKVAEAVPFVVSVPGRIVADQETVKVLARKPGLFWAESTECTLEDSLKEVSGTHGQAQYTVTLTPESARLGKSVRGSSAPSGAAKEDAGADAIIDAKQINQGKPLTVSLDTSKTERQIFRLDVSVPANQMPGKYFGKLDVSMTGSAEIAGPSEIPYEIIVEPSPWEKVAPIAIPVFILCMITCALWLFFWVRTLRR